MQDFFQRWCHSVLLAVIAALCITTSAVATEPQSALYQLYLVRHAEKQQVSSNESDPALSVCGLAQAKALATLLQQVRLPTLYHSPYQRTRQTASALLQQGRQLQQYQTAEADTLAQQLLQQQQSALVVGHSNTVPALVSLLTGREVPAMHEQQYGLIYQLNFSGQQLLTLQLLQLPAPAACQPAAR
jgi:phosphohistidine phosphatase SixA